MTWRNRIAHMPPDEIQWETLDWERWSNAEKVELLEEFKRSVPLEERQNGIEIESGFANPLSRLVEGDPFLQWGARELLLGDLEAHVNDEPLTPTEEWRSIREDAARTLREMLVQDEDRPESAPELSLHGHANRALIALDHLDYLEGAYTALHSNLADVFSEAISEAARAGFAAGRHAQAALNKPWETDAISGRKLRVARESRRDEANARKKVSRDERRKRVHAICARTSRKGGALVEYIIRELAKEGITTGKSTVYEDIKENKKVSNGR